MKKRVFSIFMVLALLLAALAGCGQNGGGSESSGKDGEREQLLGKGYYIVYDEDDELAGYLHVTSSKITVYSEAADEGDTLRYDYDAKKGLYTLEDGKLFGSGEFTVEESRKTLTLITEDEDEYTLEEIEKEDMPGPGTAKTPGFDDPAEGYVELPLGCYAIYDGRSIIGYLEVTNGTLNSYGTDGYPIAEIRYGYDRDGSCILEDDDGLTQTYQFTYEQGGYYAYFLEAGESVRLEPVNESEIPVYTGASAPDEYFIGDNGSVGLYAYLPEELYGALASDNMEDVFNAAAEYDGGDEKLLFSAVLSSGENLRVALDTAREMYDGAYDSDADLLFGFLRDTLFKGMLESYLGDTVDYDFVEDTLTIGGRSWRYCDVYLSEGAAGAYVSLMLWMEGGDMAVVIAGGMAEASGRDGDVYDVVNDIIRSLRIDT